MSSTPIKKEQQKFEQSVEDLLQVIDHNISSASLNEHHGSSSFNSQDNEEDDISPIKPLNLKQQVQQQGQSISSVLSDVKEETDTLEEKVMEDIPRAPSFDELDFNTRINRTSSLSRLSGPRQMSNSALRRTFSNRSSPNKSPNKSQAYSDSADNSPSKKSVCFEESAPKILEYDELTSDDSDESGAQDKFESKWQANLSNHPLPPPPPPKHIISTPSPQKETSIGSDESRDINLTKEDLKAHSMSLEQKLDLVLNNDGLSERVQHDETFNGSGSPSKTRLTKEEEEILYSIKNKDQIAKDEALSLANSLFEEDMRNTDNTSSILKLNPVLKRRGSASSLKDEERDLDTRIVSISQSAITLEDGMKHIHPNLVDQSTDDLVSQTSDSFQSATEIIEDSSLESLIVRHSAIASKDSTNSVSTLTEKVSRSGSVHNDLVFRGLKIEELPQDEAVELSKIVVQGPTDINEEQPPSGVDVSTEDGPNESVGSNFKLEPPISLAAIAADERDTSLTDELRGSDAFNEALELQSTNSYDVLSVNDTEPAQDNEEVVEGYRSLSPKKKQVEPFLRDENISPRIEFPTISVKKKDESLEASQHPDILLVKNFEPQESEIPLTPVISQHVDTHIPFEEEVLDETSEPQEQLPSVFEEQHHGSLVESEPEIALDEELHFDKTHVKAEDSYQSLNPSPAKEPSVKVGLPSFNSLLFHDKEPVDSDDGLTRPVDYISIWHSQPIPKSTNPQYSVRAGRSSPPKKIKKLLAKGLKDGYSEEDESTIDEPFIKKEHLSEIPKDLLTKKDSFLTKSVSRSSYINLDTSSRSSGMFQTLSASRRSSGVFQPQSVSKRSSYIKLESEFTNVEPEIKRETLYLDDNEAENDYLSKIDLPDIANTSDFGNAFAGWDLSRTETNAGDQSSAKPTNFNDNNIKSIWGSNDPSVPVSNTAVNHGKLQSMIESNSNGDTVFKSQKITSEVIIGNGQDLGVDIEFEQDSQLDIFNDHDASMEKSKGSLKTSREKLQEKQNTFRLVSGSKTGPIKSDLPMNIEHVDQSNLKNLQTRKISGYSQASEFDLIYEFDRLVQLQDHTYAVHEQQEVIVANSKPAGNSGQDNDRILDESELNMPLVPPQDVTSYEKESQIRASNREAVRGIRSPLTSVNESNLNSNLIPQSKEVRVVSPVGPRSYNRIISQANSDNENIDVGNDLNVKKRVVSEIRPVKSQQSFAPELPVNDKGRLYVHVNSLKSVQLDDIKGHKATFKLYLDNGKHKISTPKYELDSTVEINKEFEMAVENDITDLFLTLKIKYTKPENELVEIEEKIPINNPNMLSRLIGIKQKYKREKRFISRKREFDVWDNQFANDGSFGKNKIAFNVEDNDITSQTKNYTIELFNEWTTRKQSGKNYKLAPYQVCKLDVVMMYIPRTSPLESLPPSIKVANIICDHLVEQRTIQYEGFLYQEGGDCQLWKRRFFKVDGTKLIAHNENTKKPRAQINLLKVIDIIHSGNKRPRNSRNITEEILMSDTFKLAFKNGEIITFNAETKESKDKWIQVLEKVVGMNKFHQPWSRGLLEKSKSQ
jgi:hypothetical protein